MEKREIDLAAIQADRNNGMSLRLLAEKYHIPQTTIRNRLQTAERSASPEPAMETTAATATNGDARAPAKSKPRKSATTIAASNGHAVAHRNGANGDAGELRRLLDTYWQQIPDVECMKILLDRATK